MEATRSVLLQRDGQPALEIQRPMLVVIEGVEAGRQYLLPEGPVLVGRGKDADVRLEDPSASRAHARLVPDGDAWRVTDLDSKTGTRVDGASLDEATRLRPGGVLELGATRLRYERTTLLVLAPTPEAPGLGSLVGASEAMRRLFGLIRQVAPLDLPVVIQGETGTGKEAVARALHEEGPRRAGPYEVVDCTLLHGDHLRSELFGHTRGAFTGADADREGAFLRADGGTLFLDEVGELPAELQPALLRVLQEGEVRPLGASSPRRVDVRVIAASHRDLAAQVAAGALREDLYYRLAAVQLEVPPLRERRGDLPLLAEHLLDAGTRLSSEALAALEAHPWPGNVRELAQVLRVAEALAEGSALRPEDLRFQELPPPEGAAAPVDRRTRAEYEADEIRRALAEAKHNRARAAELLGIARSTLYERMKRYGIE